TRKRIIMQFPKHPQIPPAHITVNSSFSLLSQRLKGLALQLKIITWSNPPRSIKFSYSPPFTRNISANLQYFALCKTNLTRTLGVCFIWIYSLGTMRIRSWLFDHTVYLS